MGVPVDGMIQQLAKERGMTLAEAWEVVDNVAIPSLTVEGARTWTKPSRSR